MASFVDDEFDSCLTDLEEDDDDPVQILPKIKQEKFSFAKFREVVAELKRERKAREDLENSMTRLKSFAHEEQVKKREHESKEKEQTLRWEIEVASQVLFSGVEKITRKVSSLNIFPSDELPKSREYSGLRSLAYLTIKRINEIVEQLINQIVVMKKLDVSQLEVTISGLREENEKEVSEKEIMQEKLNLAEKEIDEYDSKSKLLESKIEEQFSILSKIHEQVCSAIKIVDDDKSDDLEWSNAMFLKEEMDMEENLRDSLSGMEYIYELMKIIVKKVKDQMVKRSYETKCSNEKVAQVTREKQLIVYLLRSVLSRRFHTNSSSEMSEVLKVAEDGLREAGLDIKLNRAFGNGDTDNTSSLGDRGGEEMRQDESYSLAGVMENIVRASQLEITELRHSLEEPRAESSLHRAHMEAQAKELSQSKCHIEELEHKKSLPNQNKVEGLVMDITATGEVTKGWKLAAEQEVAASRAVERDLTFQISALQQELNEAKEALLELEKRMKLKEDKASAAEESLRLADLRNSKLRERLEDVCRELESVTTHNKDSRQWRYVCWPWQWLGLDSIGYHLAETQQQDSAERELSEPLV